MKVGMERWSNVIDRENSKCHFVHIGWPAIELGAFAVTALQLTACTMAGPKH
jgi:hypothetical protein